MESVKVKCKKCGKLTNSDVFILDPVYKMMVCPNCVKERRTAEEVHKELALQKEKESMQIQVEKKPEGWDKEDEYIEKAYKAKMKSTVQVEQVGKEKIRYKCPKCNYQFLYNLEKKVPARCPYCSSDIFKFRLQ